MQNSGMRGGERVEGGEEYGEKEKEENRLTSVMEKEGDNSWIARSIVRNKRKRK